MKTEELCGACGGPRSMTSPVNVVLIDRPEGKPYRLLPSEDYLLCRHDGCRSIYAFVTRAIESHAEARTQIGDNWTRVRLVFDSLDGWIVTQDPAGTQPMGQC